MIRLLRASEEGIPFYNQPRSSGDILSQSMYHCIYQHKRGTVAELGQVWRFLCRGSEENWQFRDSVTRAPSSSREIFFLDASRAVMVRNNQSR